MAPKNRTLDGKNRTLGGMGHCVLNWVLRTWTFPRHQDATVKLKSELISSKF